MLDLFFIIDTCHVGFLKYENKSLSHFIYTQIVIVSNFKAMTTYSTVPQFQKLGIHIHHLMKACSSQ